MIRPARSARLLAPVILAACLSACVSSKGTAALQRLELPAGGEVAPESLFEDAEPFAGRASERVSVWVLPTWLSFLTNDVAHDGESVTNHRMSTLNLGIAGIPWLPLWVSGEERIARRGEPTSEASASWSPLHATSSRTAWHGDDPWVSARGMPLFYGRVDFGRPGEDPMASFHNVLWTLGPAWGWFDDRDGSEDASGWFFTPLLAAGFGPLLWTSFEFGSDSEHVSIHGPLVGALGYVSVEDRDEREEVRLLLGGVLWMDVSESYGDGRVRDSMHGPLWGMFGWGRSDGRPAVRLLWIPISF